VIRGLSADVARAATARFLNAHPDWVERHGERARSRGEEDALFHLDFLACAMELDSPESFEHYVRWSCEALGARRIGPDALVEFLGQIEDELAQRLPADLLDTVHRFTRPALALGLASAAPGTPASTVFPVEISAAAEAFLDALLRGDRATALAVVRDRLAAGAPLEQVYRVVEVVMVEVGARWQANTLSVADEHIASAVAQHVVARLYESVPAAARRQRSVTISGAPGELHQLGANIVADLVELRGVPVRFLGANVPSDALLAHLSRDAPAVLGISATLLTAVPGVRALVARVRAQLPVVPRIVVGGQAFRTLSAPAAAVGADDYAKDGGALLALIEG
jgi:methanogenic corrinoid protein MtbC1